MELLPDDDPVVEGAAGEDAAELGVPPRHLPDWSLVPRQVCEVGHLGSEAGPLLGTTAG